MTKSQMEVIKTSPIEGVRFYRTALVIERDLSFAEWEQLFSNLHAMKSSVRWWLGDCLNYGEGRFKERYAQVIDPTDYELETIRTAAWVAAKVPILRRHPEVAFDIYKRVAKFPDAEQEKILKKVVEKKMTVKEVARMLSAKVDNDKAAANAAPVVTMGYCTEFYAKMKAALDDKPLREWDPKAIEVLRAAFDSMVHEVERLYGWTH